MFEWSEEQLMIRDAVRQFVQAEIAPQREELEHGDLPPYDILRKLFATFGMDAMARERFKAQIEREKRIAAGEEEAAGQGRAPRRRRPERHRHDDAPDHRDLPALAGHGHGDGREHGPHQRRDHVEGHDRAEGALGARPATLDKVGAWAITEPGSGSDAFGSMKSTARRDGDEYLLNGSKTFITNGPYADTTVFICKLDEGNPPAERKILSFVLDKGMPGFEQSKPLRKMGMHSLADGRAVPRRRPRRARTGCIGETEDVAGRRPRGRQGHVLDGALRRGGDVARHHRALPRAVRAVRQGPGAVRPADRRVPAHPGEARPHGGGAAQRAEPRVPLHRDGRRPAAGLSLAEASAMKLYSARAATEVAMEAVQLHGGNGYMAEFQVEQLARDAKVLQIYAGTDEIQITHIAKDLLRR